MTFRRILAAALASFALFPAAASAQKAPIGEVTILISIDGFRPDYLDRVAAVPPPVTPTPGAAPLAAPPPGVPAVLPGLTGLAPVAPSLTPNLNALAAQGVRAMAMRPSYPVLTFPNHYTIVTGLRPDRHGVIDNTMEDSRRPGELFTQSHSKDAFWWNEAEPLWVTAERGGVRTATMFWPGSEAPVRGLQPRDWRAYDVKVTPTQRVDQVLAWLKRPEAERPRFVTLYFDDVDTAGHNGGPDSPELNAALTRVDAAIGRLVTGLKAQKLFATTNIVIVSDHGMAPASPTRVTWLDSLLPPASFRVVTTGQSAGVIPAEGREAEVAKVLLAKRPHLTCWRKADLPKRLHYGTNARVPPFICLAQTGWAVSTRAAIKGHSVKNGAHGYDPDDPLMSALFVAEGPGFRKGVVQPVFDNVDVYPVLARLIGVAPLANDGSLEDLRLSLAF